MNANKLSASVSRKRATVLLALGAYVNTGIVAVQGLLLIPLYLHFIGAHLYGLWMASGGVLGIMGALNFGFGNLLIQRVAHAYGQQDLPKVGAYCINGIFVYFVIASIFIIVGMLLSFGLMGFLQVSAGSEEILTYCFRLAVVAAGIGIFNECLRGIAQALLRPLFSVISLAVFRILGIAITAFLLFEEAGLWALPIGMFVIEVFVLLTALIQTATLLGSLHIKLLMDGDIIKEYFHVGGALFAAKLGNALSRESDPLLITIFLRPEVTTAYMVTRKAADLLFQMLGVIYGATHGAFSHLAGQGDDGKTGEVATKLLTIVFLSGLISFATYVGMNYSFVTLWIKKAFALDQEVILLIGMAFFANSLRNMVWQILNGFGDYNYTSLVIFIEGLGRIAFAAVLLNFIGVIGVPLSFGIASVLSIVILGIKLRHRIQLKIDNHVFSKALVVTLMLFVLGEMVAHSYEPGGSWSIFAFRAVVFVLVASAMCALFYWSMFRTLIKLRHI